MTKYRINYLLLLFSFLVGIGFLSSGVISAVGGDGSFQSPEINSDFGDYSQKEAPEQEERLPKEEIKPPPDKSWWDRTVDIIKSPISGLKKLINGAWEITKEALESFLSWLEDVLGPIGKIIVGIAEFVIGVVDVVVAAVEGILSLAEAIIDIVLHPIDTLKTIWHAVTHPMETLEKAWDGVKEKVKQIHDSFVRDVINGDYRSALRWLGKAAGEVGLCVVPISKLAKLRNARRPPKAPKSTSGMPKGGSWEVPPKKPSIPQRVAGAVKQRVADVKSQVTNTVRSVKTKIKNTKQRFKEAKPGKKVAIAAAAAVSVATMAAGVPFVKPILKNLIECGRISYHQTSGPYAMIPVAKPHVTETDVCKTAKAAGAETEKGGKEESKPVTPKGQYELPKVTIPKPKEPRGEPLEYVPIFKQEAIALKTYKKFRGTGLDKQEIDTFSKNTGLSLDESIKLKTHVFLTKHVNMPYEGKHYYKDYFHPETDIAYGWEEALKRELNAEEKAWFRTLADHELDESRLMQAGTPYRKIEDARPSGGYKDKKNGATGAHDLAKEPPGRFPGFEDIEDITTVP